MGRGTFTTVPLRPGSDTTHSIAVGDMDGDGDLDIVDGNCDQPNVVYLNDGATYVAIEVRVWDRVKRPVTLR